jgi:hypothetical protein
MRKEESDAGKVFGLRPPFIGSLSSVDLVARRLSAACPPSISS